MGEAIFMFIGIMVVGGIISAFQKNAVTAPGRALHQRFVNLGNLQGKSKHEIIATVGQPSSISGLPDGKTLLQWQATGCHMALRFDGDICEGITHQHLHQG